MSNFLKQNNLGTATHEHMRLIRETVTNRWENLGFLNGLKGYKKETMAMLFENQAKTIVESTVTDSSGSFETIVFPMVRRIFSKLLANDIVSVQALNLPIGKLFFFVPKISARDAEGRHTSTMADQLPPIENFAPEMTQWQEKNLYDMYYNDGLIDHSKGAMKLITVAPAKVAPKLIKANGEFEEATALQVATDGTVREVVIAITGFQEYQGKLAFQGANGQFRANGVQMDTESFLSSLKVVTKEAILDRDGNTIVEANGQIPFGIFTQKYGKAIVEVNRHRDELCNSNGTLHLRLDLTHPVALNAQETYDGYIGADIELSDLDLIVSFVEYENLEMSTEMGEVTFELDEVTVSTEPRKLRATWSPELAQDVNAFQNIDAEAELTAMLSEQIAAEIDREILKDIRVSAAWRTRWNRAGWKSSSMASNAYTQKDWNQTLITEINQISAQIQKSTLRGGATYIVVSTEVSAVLNDLEYFHVSDANAEADQYNMGIEKVGTLQGRYIVYVDPYAPANSIIVGHKGKNLLDTGYIYAPYVPLQLTPTMYNHNNFAPVKGISTRYAKKVVNNKFFGHVQVDGLKVFNPHELR